MSYFVVDANGKFQGDLATVAGIRELDKTAGMALAEFLTTGEANKELASEIVAEVKGTELEYLQPLFQGQAPFILSNGIAQGQ